nr:probable protein phosphatase 2C 60 isoform X2 [Tanacetum cinerariifolium]
MEDAHAAHPDLNGSTSFFGVCDGHGGKVVAKFCAKFLHQQVLKQEAYPTGDIETSVQKPFLRMDEMIRGQRGWRELLALGDKINKFTCVIEGLIWSPRGGEGNRKVDEWAFEEVLFRRFVYLLLADTLKRKKIVKVDDNIMSQPLDTQSTCQTHHRNAGSFEYCIKHR